MIVFNYNSSSPADMMIHVNVWFGWSLIRQCLLVKWVRIDIYVNYNHVVSLRHTRWLWQSLILIESTPQLNCWWDLLSSWFNIGLFPGVLVPNKHEALTLEHWSIQFKFSVTRSCVSLPRYTTSSDWKFMLFVKFKSQHISVFQDWKYILLLTTGSDQGWYRC